MREAVNMPRVKVGSFEVWPAWALNLTCVLAVLLLALPHPAFAQYEMQGVGAFRIDRTQVSAGQFQKFVAAMRTVTAAERAGGGSTFEAGWELRPGWTWRAPFGTPAAASEPAVHVTYDEAACFANGRASGRRRTQNGLKRLTPSAGLIRLPVLQPAKATRIQRTMGRAVPIA